MKIYSIILIIQLKFFAIIIIKVSDSYKKIINIESFLIHDNNDNFDINEIEIDRIMEKKMIRKKTHYLFK